MTREEADAVCAFIRQEFAKEVAAFRATQLSRWEIILCWFTGALIANVLSDLGRAIWAWLTA